MTNRKNTRRALFASVISMLLCVTMLVGSTFAWFTDNASTAVNTIQAGTLDIQLVDPETGENMEGKTIEWVSADDDVVLWEPGVTYISETVRLVNNSNLSIEFMAEVTGIKGDEKLLEVIEFKVVQADDIVESDPWSTPASFTSTGVLHSWVFGTLANWEEEGYGVGTAKPLSDIVVMAHMKEEAGNEYQGLTLEGVGITVVAKQTPEEYDSFTNQYDANAVYPITEAEALDEALNDPDVTDVIVGGGNYTETVTIPAGKDVSTENGTFDTTASGNSYVPIVLADDASLTVNGGTYMCSKSFAQIIDAADSTVVINSGSFTGGALVWLDPDSDIEINGGTFDVWTITVIDGYNNAPVVINGGTFTLGEGGFDANQDINIVINGGTFNQDPTKWLGEGHTATYSNGLWTVK